MNTLEMSATYDYTMFSWDSSARTFSGDMRGLPGGFTGEHWDGEARGLAIQGKTGEILYFHIAEEIRCDDDMVDYWVLKPSSSRGRELVSHGIIYNA